MKNVYKISIFTVAFASIISLKSFAGLVHAPIESMNYDNESYVLSASGHLPTSCAASPAPTLNLTEDPQVLQLSVVANQDSEICAGALGGPYALAFDIRSLKSKLVELNLNPEATYQIITESKEFVVTVDFAEGPFHFSYASQRHVGRVFAVTDSGEALMAVAPNHSDIIVVKSPYINLALFVGQEVEVQGHALLARTKIESLPQNFGPKKSEDRAFLVTGINSTSL